MGSHCSRCPCALVSGAQGEVCARRDAGIANRGNDLRACAAGCKGLRPVAKTLILTAISRGITVDTAAVYGRRRYCSVTRETSVKNKLMLGAVLLALSLPTWAAPWGWSPPPPPPPPPSRRTAVPEGGNWQAYAIVSGAALLAGLMLARKRETETIADRS